MATTVPASAAAATSMAVGPAVPVKELIHNLPYASELSQAERRELLAELSEQLDTSLVPVRIPALLIKLTGGVLTALAVVVMWLLNSGSIFGVLIAFITGMVSSLALIRAPLAMLRARRMAGPRAALLELRDRGTLDDQQRAGVEALLEEFNRAN